MEVLQHLEDPLIGACLDGRYVVTDLLARGGMGTVYAGVHEQLGCAVAIKVLSRDTASDPVVVERFMREARLASSFRHGNIVDVSDFGELQDGRPYLVMPRVHGVDFATLLENEGPMPAERVAELLRGVAAALDLVHAKGLAHRDVKPENLMHVLHEDGSETVMLTDFGIAGLIAVKAARLTADGMVCGTPAYMAPELVATGEFDQRADVYALATVAFEMLTGRLPFSDVHSSRVLTAKIARTAPSLGSVAGRRFEQAVEDVVARGLVRYPEERFQSAGAFVAALERAARNSDATEAPTLAPMPREQHESAVHARESLSESEPSLSLAALPRAASGRDIARPRAQIPVLAAVLTVVVPIGWWLVSRADAPPALPVHQPALPAPTPIASIEAPASQPHASQPAAIQPSLPAKSGRPGESAMRDSRAQSVRTSHDERRATRSTAAPPTSLQTASNVPAVPSIDEVNRAANQELLQGRIDSALVLLERASERDPRSAAAWRGLGVVYERLGRSAEAVRAYRRALELEPQGPRAGTLRARLRKLEPAP
jgi:serine/threonine protein kinase